MKRSTLLLGFLTGLLCISFNCNAGPDTRVLLDSTAVRMFSDGSGIFNVYKRVSVLTPQGALSYRVLKYDYDPLTANAAFKYAIVRHKDGAVDSIRVSRTLDYAAPAHMIYWGARQIMLPVGALEVGDTLEYEIEKSGFSYALLAGEDNADGRFTPPMKGEFYDIVPFWVTEPTDRKVYRLYAPRSKELQFQFYNGDCSSSVRFTPDGGRIYSFAVNDAKPFNSEPGMADLYDVAPKLLLSTTRQWKEKSLWFHGINEDYGSFSPTPEAESLVKEILKGKKGEMEIISTLTHWVADNIRYAGISMGEGEGYTLHTLKMNLADRCGVCKDIAGTLIGLLRIAGFEAYPAMTMAGSRIENIPADHFNHCVVVVKLKDGTYMPLDPTWVPFTRELWSSAEQQQNYLPGIPEGSDLLETPVVAAEKNPINIESNNILDENGTLHGSFTISAEGWADKSIRSIFTRNVRRNWNSLLEKELLAISPKAKMISVSYGKDPLDYQSNPVTITYKFEIPDYAVVGDGELAFKPVTASGIFNRVFSFRTLGSYEEDRNYSFKCDIAKLVTVTEDTVVPKGYLLEGGSRKQKSGGADTWSENSLSQNYAGLHLKQKIRLGKRVYKAEDWSDFRAAVTNYNDYCNWIILKKK